MTHNGMLSSKKIIITLATLLIIVIGLSAMVIYPNGKRIKELSQDIYTKRVEAEKIFNRGQNLRSVIEQYNKIKPTLSKLKSVFVTENKELDLFTSLETLASNLQLEPEVKLSSSESSKKDRKLPLQIKLQSNYAQLLNYLVGLEDLDYYINISSLRLAATKDKSSQSLTTLLLAEAYYQP